LIRLAKLHFGIEMVLVALHDEDGQYLCACDGVAADIASQALSLCTHGTQA
jgi:hypothetical protein